MVNIDFILEILYLSEMIRKYPIGIQSFRKIREEDHLYVDTIEELFRKSRELFEGLWIADRWDWSKTNPVIHFNFADMGVRTIGLEAAIYKGYLQPYAADHARNSPSVSHFPRKNEKSG